MLAEYDENIPMKKTFENTLLVLCIIGLLLTSLSWFL